MDNQTLLSPEQIGPAKDITDNIQDQLNQILLGRENLHRMVLIGILSQGHILLEGLPGLGKTALVHAIGSIMNFEFRRVQFTPDLMPGDILGHHILQENEAGQREMTFQPGPVFTNILLADEINRASPKTQSAMLETMQERSVTLMGTTRRLPDPFFVLASQNPIELEGTYPLPEAQLDRFLFRLMVTDVDVDVMEEIISTRRRGQVPEPTWTLAREDFNALDDVMGNIYLPKPVARYIARVVAASHPGGDEAPEGVKNYITYGASPRAAIALAEAARAHALIEGRPTAGFEDVKTVATHALNHRIILNYKARFDKLTPHEIVDEILNSLDEAGMDLPRQLVVESEAS